MIGEGVFREDCLSLCCLQASSAAAEPIMHDEVCSQCFSGSERIGVCFFGYFLCSYKESNSPIKGEKNAKTRAKKVPRR
jgi:hypothetical protein